MVDSVGLGGEDTAVGLESTGAAPDTAVSHRRPDAPLERGAAVGRYLVVDRLGAGGMGVVYSAYDPELDRKLAIKLLLPDTFDAERSNRLLREAQAMAKLNHPHVVTVHDVGTIGERIYVAMEFVDGPTLTKWLRERERSWQEIVRVFLEAGRGLAAAHDVGLVHRDFKPDNVMLEDAGRVRVMDFGLARAETTPTGAARSSAAKPSMLASELTAAGTVMGTPAYMSPEQFEGGAVDARSDQFSFCVALWEALYGTRPFRGDTFTDLVLAVTSGRREAPTAGRRVPGWLRRVLDRGLATAPGDRWPSMRALLAELDRSTGKLRIVLGGVAITATALGVGALLWDRARADLCSGSEDALAEVWGAQRKAEAEAAVLATDLSFAGSVWAREAAELDAWAAGWAAMHRETCEATRIREEQSESVMDLRMACLGRAKLELDAIVEVLVNATPAIVGKAHEVVAGLPRLERCEDVEALRAEVAPPEPEEAAQVAAIEADLAESRARRAAGDFDTAMTAVDRAATAIEGLAYAPIGNEVALERGFVLTSKGKYAEAEAALAEAQEGAARSRQWGVMRSATVQLIRVVGTTQGRHAEALRLRELALGLATESPRELANARSEIAGVLWQQGKYDEAEVESRAALAIQEQEYGPRHPRVAAVHDNLAILLSAKGDYPTAENEERLAVSIREAALGPEHPEVAAARSNLATILWKQGKHVDAEAEARAALALREKALGADHPELAQSHNNLANALRSQHRWEEAEASFRRALALVERGLGAEHPAAAAIRNNIASTLAGRKDYAAALVETRAALAIRERELGGEHPEVGQSHHNIGFLLESLGDVRAAEDAYRRGLAIREKALGPDHPDVAGTLAELGDLVLARGDAQEGVAMLERAWSIYEHGSAPPAKRGAAAFALARALWPDQSARARSLAEQALAAFAEAGDTRAKDRAEVEAWLRAHASAG